MRELKGVFEDNPTMKSVNNTINSKTKNIAQNLKLSVDLNSRGAWNTILSPIYCDIPFSQVGLGDQCIVKTLLSTSKKETIKKRILLIEEPESHLSHTKMYELLGNLSDFSGQLFITTHNSFVANKLDLQNLIVIDNQNGIIKSSPFIDSGCKERLKFFTKSPNYPTLRIVLCKKAILVEGPTDEMLLLYYFQQQFKQHPFEKGIELIVVNGNKMFPRFTEIANAIEKQIAIITDNDRKTENDVKNRVNPNNYSNVAVFTDSDPVNHTIEPSFVAANIDNIDSLSKLISNKQHNDAEKLINYMINHKTEWAYQLLSSENFSYSIPTHIINAVNWIIGE